MSFIFHLLFLCSVLSLSSCSGRYDFSDSRDAIIQYRDFLHSIKSLQSISTEELADNICQWQELSDTVFNYISRDPAFTAHAGLSMNFIAITDSVKAEFMRLSDKCTLRDVAYVKLHTSPYREDKDLDSVKNQAAAFFASLDRNPVYNSNNVSQLMMNYRRFLSDTSDKGISSGKDLLSFLETEDRHFRTFLAHLDDCSKLGVSDITRMTEQNISMICKAASSKKLKADDTMVYLAMRTDRRLLINAQLCSDQIRKGKVSSSEIANAYLWMTLQPFLSMDSFSISMLSDSQRQQMMDIAESFPKLAEKLSSTDYYGKDLTTQIPTQLMRLYISTL